MKQWVLRKEVPEKISKELKQWPEVIRHLLFYRGVKRQEDAGSFLNPDYDNDLYDPFKILNMEKAVERIIKAIKNNEKIMIFSDYDADGICASVIFNDFFKKIGFENFHIHIPDRHLEGYGLNMETIDEAIEQKMNLIITLDCGVTDYNEVEKANNAGIDVVVIDHHLPPEKLPNAFAIIDSKQKDDNYPFEHLCGAGVTFKTIQALVKKRSAQGGFNIIPGWEKWLLDVVAVATIADMVPLIDENRTLAYYGLKVLQKTQRRGILSLFRRLNLNLSGISEDDISFMIAPRINIASRMDHANASFNLLITESPEEADWISGHLEMLNSDRRNLVENILNGADKKLETKKPKIIITGDFTWNPGVIGLAGGRLVEKYNCPVFLWAKGEAKQIKGSARSDGSINVVELMKMVPEGILIEAGGHALAGGFSINEDKINDFENELLKAFEKIPKQKTENNILYIDKKLDISEVNWEFYKTLEQLRPFGIDNPKPVFLFNDLEIANSRKFGNAGIHLQLDFKKSNGEKVSAIGFFMADSPRHRTSSTRSPVSLEIGQKIDLLASLEKSTFRDTPELRLKIVDIRIK